MSNAYSQHSRRPVWAAGFVAVLRRESLGLANTAIGWLVAAFMLALSSTSFFWIERFFERDVASLEGYLDIWPALFAFVIPALTMRSFAEERSSGMHEILSVLPVSAGTVVSAKFAALAGFMVATLACATPVAFGVSLLGELSVSLVVTQFAALMLLSWCMIAVGLLISALSPSQLVAYVVTTVVLVTFNFLDLLPPLLGLGGAATDMARTVSLNARYERPAQGLLSIADLAYFGVVVVVFLRATTHAINARRY